MADSLPNEKSSFWLKWAPVLVVVLVLLTPCFLSLPMWFPGTFPPAWWERKSQRKQVVERVQAAGGWEALRRDCMALAQTNEFINWIRWRKSNKVALPPTISALQPKEVYYVSPQLLGPNSAEPRIPVVRIKIFGMHSTGGHSTPYFGLEVVAMSSSEDYTPKARPAASGNGHRNYRKVSEGVYEVY